MKGLHWFNLVGVFLLLGLCAAQWQRDRRLNLEINQLERHSQSQQAKLAEQEKVASGLTNDLARFKAQFMEALAEANEARAIVHKLEEDYARIAGQNDQLKASVTNWVQAVQARDESLRDQNEQFRALNTRYAHSILKFNELATNYNLIIRRFDELATNYNGVVGQLNEARKGKKASP